MRPLAAALLAAVSLALPAAAHPGIGIVVDRSGAIFYTDLKRVWRVGPEGTKTVAVPDVHTHELFLDADGALFGEHLWYEGDATQKWGHRVWRLGPDGKLADVVPPTEGFLADASFVRDAAGAMYWAAVPDGARDTADRVLVRRRAPDGAIATIAGGAAASADGRGREAGFRAIRWMTAAPDGTLHLIDAGALRRVAPDGRVTTLARLGGGADRHELMGLVWDGGRFVYVANTAERRVDRVDATTGEVAAFATPRSPWAPSGVTVGPSGAVYVLEGSGSCARVTKIDAATGRAATFD